MITYEKVSFGSECNNSCVCCTARDEAKISGPNDLISQIDTLADSKNLVLSGGEPTIYDDLPYFISHARSKGARRIKLVTNGRRLADWDFLTNLVEQGCHLFELKIEGSTPEIHENVTGVRGSFSETMQGLENLCALLGSSENGAALYLAVRVAVCRANLQDLTATVGLLASFGVDRIILGRKSSDFPLSEGAHIAANAVRLATLNRVWSACEGFPPCLMKGSERHLMEFLQPKVYKGEKPKVCRKCSYNSFCGGPPDDYLRNKGPREYRAVTSSPYLEDITKLLEKRNFNA